MLQEMVLPFPSDRPIIIYSIFYML